MTEDDTEQFRQQAEECRREAEKAITPWTREAWLKLAADWLRLAQLACARTQASRQEIIKLTHYRWEPCAGIPPARIWAGSGQ
jgi:hypothetical protein